MLKGLMDPNVSKAQYVMPESHLNKYRFREKIEINFKEKHCDDEITSLKAKNVDGIKNVVGRHICAFMNHSEHHEVTWIIGVNRKGIVRGIDTAGFTDDEIRDLVNDSVADIVPPIKREHYDLIIFPVQDTRKENCKVLEITIYKTVRKYKRKLYKFKDKVYYGSYGECYSAIKGPFSEEEYYQRLEEKKIRYRNHDDKFVHEQRKEDDKHMRNQTSQNTYETKTDKNGRKEDDKHMRNQTSQNTYEKKTDNSERKEDEKHMRNQTSQNTYEKKTDNSERKEDDKHMRNQTSQNTDEEKTDNSEMAGSVVPTHSLVGQKLLPMLLELTSPEELPSVLARLKREYPWQKYSLDKLDEELCGESAKDVSLLGRRPFDLEEVRLLVHSAIIYANSVGGPSGNTLPDAAPDISPGHSNGRSMTALPAPDTPERGPEGEDLENADKVEEALKTRKEINKKKKGQSSTAKHKEKNDNTTVCVVL